MLTADNFMMLLLKFKSISAQSFKISWRIVYKCSLCICITLIANFSELMSKSFLFPDFPQVCSVWRHPDVQDGPWRSLPHIDRRSWRDGCEEILQQNTNCKNWSTLIRITVIYMKKAFRNWIFTLKKYQVIFCYYTFSEYSSF